MRVWMLSRYILVPAVTGARACICFLLEEQPSTHFARHSRSVDVVACIT